MEKIEMNPQERLRVLLIRCGQKLGSNHGGRQTQGRILKILYYQGPMTQKVLQKKLDIQPGSMSEIAAKEHKQAANKLKNVLATYNEAEDLINIGAYKKGSNPNIDYAISKIDDVNSFLCQGTEEKFTFEETVQMLEDLFANQE